MYNEFAKKHYKDLHEKNKDTILKSIKGIKIKNY